MDKILYSQVLITCTTINVISIISMFGVIIADKLHGWCPFSDGRNYEFYQY